MSAAEESAGSPSLSDEQLEVVAEIEAWLKTNRRKLSFGGYAGTGKTTIIAHLFESLDASVCAFTGKAASVLRSKGVPAGTIHSLIYKPYRACASCGRSATTCKCGSIREVTRFRKVSDLDTKLVIVDEASMVNRRLMEDLESFGVKVLYVGDHGQLEPVGDDAYIMEDPDIRLETVHRQAAGSPIIQLAHHLREGGEPRTFGDEAQVRVGIPGDVDSFDVVLCGFNHTRVAVNHKIRAMRGHVGRLPEPGERVICLRNSREYEVFNGLLATVTKMDERKLSMSVVDDAGFEYEDLPFDPSQFGARTTKRDADFGTTLWDFGYCITVHKSQGSEERKVLVLEQISRSWSAERWRYTAATRASERLVYCLSPRRSQ